MNSISRIKDKIKRILKYIGDCLCADKVPVWLTIFLAFVSYYLSPLINQEFEKQKIQVNYIINNLDSFNMLSGNFFNDLTTYNHRLIEKKPIDNDLLNRLRGRITELQLRILELDIIFDDAKSVQIIKQYKISLDDLREAIEDNDVSKIIQTTTPYLQQSREIIRMLASRAGITIND